MLGSWKSDRLKKKTNTRLIAYKELLHKNKYKLLVEKADLTNQQAASFHPPVTEEGIQLDKIN